MMEADHEKNKNLFDNHPAGGRDLLVVDGQRPVFALCLAAGCQLYTGFSDESNCMLKKNTDLKRCVFRYASDFLKN